MSELTKQSSIPLWRRLRWQIIFTVIFLTVTPLVVVSFITLTRVRDAAKEQVINQLESVAVLKESQIDRYFNEAVLTLDGLADTPGRARQLNDFAASQSPTTQRLFISVFQSSTTTDDPELEAIFEEIFFYDANGLVLASSNEERIGNNIDSDLFFDNGLSNESHIQPPYFSEEANELVFVVTRRIIFDENVVGVLAGRLNLPILQNLMLERTGLGDTGETYLMGSNNSTLLTPSRFDNYDLFDDYHSEGIDAALQQQDGSGAYTNYRGEEVFGVYRWLPQLNAGLIAEVTQDEALETTQALINANVIIYLIALFITIIIGFIWSNSILRPIYDLTRGARLLASGQYETDVKVNSQNEIGQLARTFNSMAKQLNDLLGTLERRVNERTEQLEEARQKAEAASNAKSVFLSNMSHELRTPLNMVIGYTSSILNMPQMYEGEELPIIFRNDIELIQTNGMYLLGLINDILDLSKIEAGKLELQYTAVDLGQIFQGVIATSIGLLQDKPIQVRPDYSEQLPLGWCDPLRIRQILLNLMSNAIKFTETGSVTLQAKGIGKHIEISVIDTGIGIPEATRQVIFDRFQQASQAHNVKGTGLGLDISQKLAQMHGSDIEIRSKVGRGSTFLFKIPVATQEQINTAKPAQEASLRTGIKVFNRKSDEPSIQPATILLIEDDSDTRQMLQSAFESQGYHVVTASQSKTAQDLAIALVPDLIVLDIYLIQSTGWEVLEYVRAQPATQSIPVILLSVSDNQEKAKSLQANLMLKKPIDLPLMLNSAQLLLEANVKKVEE